MDTDSAGIPLRANHQQHSSLKYPSAHEIKSPEQYYCTAQVNGHHQSQQDESMMINCGAANVVQYSSEPRSLEPSNAAVNLSGVQANQTLRWCPSKTDGYLNSLDNSYSGCNEANTYFPHLNQVPPTNGYYSGGEYSHRPNQFCTPGQTEYNNLYQPYQTRPIWQPPSSLIDSSSSCQDQQQLYNDYNGYYDTHGHQDQQQENLQARFNLQQHPSQYASDLSLGYNQRFAYPSGPMIQPASGATTSNNDQYYNHAPLPAVQTDTNRPRDHYSSDTCESSVMGAKQHPSNYWDQRCANGVTSSTHSRDPTRHLVGQAQPAQPYDEHLWPNASLSSTARETRPEQRDEVAVQVPEYQLVQSRQLNVQSNLVEYKVETVSTTKHSLKSSNPLAPVDSVQKSNQCTVCGRNYARPSTLKTHLRTHTNERPFKCNVCLKTFSQAANLTAHQRVHTGERPFSCPICSRQFSQSSSVITHLRTHSGERPYRCTMCSRTFSDSSTLTKHCRIHSGEKPYQCDFCPLNFSQSGNLSRHLKLHLASNNRGANGASNSTSGSKAQAGSTTSKQSAPVSQQFPSRQSGCHRAHDASASASQTSGTQLSGAHEMLENE